MIKYRVITSENNLNTIKKLNVKMYKLEFIKENDETSISFYTNSINKLTGVIEFESIDLNKKRFLFFIKEYSITLIGILLFLFMLIIINRTITEIEFVDNNTYDEDVLNVINDELDTFYKFKFLNKKLSLINDRLKQTFYEYEWINVEKEGSKLLVNITKSTDINNNINNDNFTYGSLYSKYDAYIIGYYVKNGKIVISNNMSVRKDDELISGIIPIYSDKYMYVKADGYVIGEVYENIDITVYKYNSFIERSGRFITYNKVLFGNQDIDSPFENYDTVITEVFSLFKFIKYVKVELYELVERNISYDSDSGNLYAKSQILKEFNENSKYDFEKIVSVKLLNMHETDDSYVYTYGVKSIRDITYFKELK